MRRFQLPSDWRLVPLSSVADVQTGLALGKKAKVDPIRLPYLRVANVQDGFLDLSEIKEVTIERSLVSRYSLRYGDVLMTEGGDFDKLGRGYIWHEEIPNCLHQNHVFVVRPHEELLSYFLASLTSSDYGRAYFQSCSKQSTNLASINSSQLKAFPVPLPTRSEQKSITQVLSAWDRGIRQLGDLITAKLRFKQGLMQQLLNGKRRFLEFSGHQWCRVHLGELLREESRYVDWNDDEKYRLVSIRRRSGGMFFRESKYGRDIKTQVMKTTEVGDFVIARMQAVHGAMAVTPPEFDGFHVSDSYSTFVAVDPSRLSMSFLGYLSQTPMFYRLALLSAYGVTIEKMTFDLDWFLAESVLIPPTLEEQERIVEVLRECDLEIGVLQRELDVLKTQKKGLMKKLLTGQVRMRT